MPSLSIITPTFNAAATIDCCLKSVQGQTVPCEHLIIDGGSVDHTLRVIKKIQRDAKIVSEPDCGIYDALNKGIRSARGDVVGILHADDFYAAPDILEKVARVFVDPQVDSCYGDLVYVAQKHVKCEKGNVKREKGETGDRPWVRGQGGSTDNSEVTIQHSKFRVVRYWKSGEFWPERFYQGWMVPHPTFFVRRSVYEKYGLFRLDMGSAADYELMLRFLLRNRISTRYIPEVLVRMRIGGTSNASLKNRLAANRMDRKAWTVNGLRPYPWTTWLKPLRKVRQWMDRPGG